MNAGFFSRPYPGESVCGDAVAVVLGASSITAAVIDGLGHGPEAHLAAEAARAAILSARDESPLDLVMRCHRELKGTRGAALAVVRLTSRGEGAFCGVGNISVATGGQHRLSLISHAGIVGQRLRKALEYPFTLPPGEVIGLFSDGMPSGLSLAGPQPTSLDESARWLVTQYGRPNDDATLLLIQV